MARELGLLELKLLTMAVEGGGENRDERGNGDRERIGQSSGRLSPRAPARSGGQAGRELRGGAGRRGGHLLLLLARRKTTQGMGLGQVSVR